MPRRSWLPRILRIQSNWIPKSSRQPLTEEDEILEQIQAGSCGQTEKLVRLLIEKSVRLTEEAKERLLSLILSSILPWNQLQDILNALPSPFRLSLLQEILENSSYNETTTLQLVKATLPTFNEPEALIACGQSRNTDPLLQCACRRLILHLSVIEYLIQLAPSAAACKAVKPGELSETTTLFDLIHRNYHVSTQATVLEAIELVVHACPAAVQVACGTQRMLPLHIAVRRTMPPHILELLLQAHPEAIYTPDASYGIPVDVYLSLFTLNQTGQEPTDLLDVNPVLGLLIGGKKDPAKYLVHFLAAHSIQRHSMQVALVTLRCQNNLYERDEQGYLSIHHAAKAHNTAVLQRLLEEDEHLAKEHISDKKNQQTTYYYPLNLYCTPVQTIDHPNFHPRSLDVTLVNRLVALHPVALTHKDSEGWTPLLRLAALPTPGWCYHPSDGGGFRDSFLSVIFQVLREYNEYWNEALLLQ